MILVHSFADSIHRENDVKKAPFRRRTTELGRKMDCFKLLLVDRLYLRH